MKFQYGLQAGFVKRRLPEVFYFTRTHLNIKNFFARSPSFLF